MYIGLGLKSLSFNKIRRECTYCSTILPYVSLAAKSMELRKSAEHAHHRTLGLSWRGYQRYFLIFYSGVFLIVL